MDVLNVSSYLEMIVFFMFQTRFPLIAFTISVHHTLSHVILALNFLHLRLFLSLACRQQQPFFRKQEILGSQKGRTADFGKDTMAV